MRLAEADRERLDVHAAPARGEVMAELVDEHENAEHDDEREHAAHEIRNDVEHVDDLRFGVSRSGAARSRVRSGGLGGGEALGGAAARPASRAITWSSVVAAGVPSTSSTRSTVSTISRKPIRRCRKASTATSFAAFRIAGAPPPARSASRASRSAGKADQVGLLEVQPADRGQIEPRRRRGDPLRPGQGVGDRNAHVRASRAAPSPSRRGSRPCRGSPIADAPARRSASRRRSNRRAASITSRPLFIIVAESMLILAPIDHIGWRSAASGVARGHLLPAGGAERAARRGQDDPLDGAAVAVGHRLEDRVVLGIDRQQRRAGLAHGAQHHLAGADQASLLASATALPRRIAARVGARPAAPVIAAMVQSASQSRRPRPPPRRRPRPAMPVPASASRSAGEAGGIGDHGAFGVQRDGLLGQQRRVAAGDQRPDAEALAASRRPADRSVCVPTLPVLPRTVTDVARVGAAVSLGFIATGLLLVRQRAPAMPRPAPRPASASSRSSRPPWPGMSGRNP